ncbi:rod shape-determining protein RodA [Salegentibacter maritimus]|uniref:Rod shape-determining protein RodA n=1 Tax=Salegentibacter maritimus TaxID=2794347 RepID=A0ABS0TJJ5_9FLAO|nr:rod shape-determining protein RodA [Salegentibacter maritimus]MBI6121202.1 rod shape-determining protein RodA [Salegentibacter maritimus]
MTKSSTGFDWITILIYILLVGFGWINIYSASLGTNDPTDFFNMNVPYGRQALFISLSVVLIILLLSIEAKFYQRFSSIIYSLSLLSLVGLFIFGSTIAGQTAWYQIGPISIQPSEFAKAATALAVAKYLSGIQTNIRDFKHQLKVFLIIALPMLLVLLQPDAGSAMVYFSFAFALYREGLHFVYLLLGFFAASIFVATLALGPLWVICSILLIAALVYLKNLKRKPNLIKYLFFASVAVGFSLSVNYVFENVFKQHHRDRFNIVLGKEVDSRGIGYNTNQSEIAIGSGGLFGKGWTEGTQTKGHFVPEQHTDYIFSTVGEEWGFMGSTFILGLFVLLMLRLLYLAERQKSTFSRVYGYGVIGILFMHFLVNIGMVIGIFPTVGIPLPFLSYGGSGLWAFTTLLFIFIKLDSQRISF